MICRSIQEVGGRGGEAKMEDAEHHATPRRPMLHTVKSIQSSSVHVAYHLHFIGKAFLEMFLKFTAGKDCRVFHFLLICK
jgi:hypothetical protein